MSQYRPPAPYYPQAVYYGAPPPKPPVAASAVAALVTSLLSLGLVGIALGAFSLYATRGGRMRGSGMGIAGIAIGLIWAPWNIALIAGAFSAMFGT